MRHEKRKRNGTHANELYQTASQLFSCNERSFSPALPPGFEPGRLGFPSVVNSHPLCQLSYRRKRSGATGHQIKPSRRSHPKLTCNFGTKDSEVFCSPHERRSASRRSERCTSRSSQLQEPSRWVDWWSTHQLQRSQSQISLSPVTSGCVRVFFPGMPTRPI